MKRVVDAVTAGPPGFNCGMAAVERALAAIASEAEIDIRRRWLPALLSRRYRMPGAAEVRRRMDTGLPEPTALAPKSALDADGLLFWGDFHHMRQYIEEVAAMAGDSLERTMQLLLPDARSEGGGPIWSFGSTMLFNGGYDLADGTYRRALTDFLHGASGVWLRDITSVAAARRLAQADKVRLGVDPALLLHRPPRHGSGGDIAVFLARTPPAHQALLEVTRMLQTALGARAVWLDWGDEGGFPYLPERAFRDHVGPTLGGGAPAGEVLECLAGARAVVTDAYHLALIAWSWGIPAVTITGRSDPSIPASVNGGRISAWRDKRELVASQYGALEFVLRYEDWSDPRRLGPAIARVEQALDARLIDGVRSAIVSDTRRARAELLQALRGASALAPAPSPRWSSGTRGHAGPPPASAVAILTLRNEYRHVHGVLQHLVLQGLDVAVIDHSSADGTREAVEEWRDRGVIWIETLPFDGNFDLAEALRRADVLAESFPHDWVVHVDADEWMHPRGDGDRLVDLFARADLTGSTVVEFDEFTFVPDVDLRSGVDARIAFRTYYHYRPPWLHLMRARRRALGLSNVEGAGHIVHGHDVRLHSEAAVLRHYPVLSPEHGAEKYGSRTFSPSDLSRGWHFDRIALPADGFAVSEHPALRRLPRWNSRAFDRSAPASQHYWEWTRAGSPHVSGPR